MHGNLLCIMETLSQSKESKLLLSPRKDIWWCSMSTGPSFFRVVASDRIEGFITGRDKEGISRIGCCTITVGKNQDLYLDSISAEPVFDIGEDGCFDESGVSYPWIVNSENTEYMYYVGWVNGGKNRFQNFLGLARRSYGESSFRRHSKCPILDRTENEPYGTGSCCVVEHEGQWIMLYTSFLPWKGLEIATAEHPHSQPSYNIKWAVSKDLIEWRRSNETILDFESGEHIHGKPVLIKESNSLWRLYFSCRGKAYRIGRSHGPSPISQLRNTNMSISISSWHSETQEYAFPVDLNGYRYLFFNGNGYGRTGLGYVVLKLN